MLHRKIHIVNHIDSIGRRLADHIAILAAHGVDTDKITKNNYVKQLKAKMRQAKKKLATMVALESQMAAKADTRIRKQAAAKSGELPGKSRKKKDSNAPPAKKRRKRRMEMDENERTE